MDQSAEEGKRPKIAPISYRQCVDRRPDRSTRIRIDSSTVLYMYNPRRNSTAT